MTIKILLVELYGLQPGHNSVEAGHLCRNFLKLGNEVTLLTTDGLLGDWDQELPVQHIMAEQRSPLIRKLNNLLNKLYSNKQGTPFIGLRVIRNILKKVRDYEVQKIAFGVGNKKSPDVIHFLEANNTLPLAMVLARYGRGRNIVVTIRHLLAPLKKEMRLREGPFLRRLDLIIRQLAQRWILRNYKCILQVRQQLRPWTKNGKITLPLKNVSVIPAGTEVFYSLPDRLEARDKLGIDYQGRIFLFFGQIRLDKGIDFVFEALSKMKHSFKLLIAGKPIGVDIAGMIEKSGWNEDVYLYPQYIPEKEVPLYFSASDAVILAHKRIWVGNSGVLLQACQYQRPIVGTEHGLTGEFVRNWNLGITFESENPVQLRFALEQFMTLTEDEVERMEASAKEFVKYYSWENVVKKHLAVYQQQV